MNTNTPAQQRPATIPAYAHPVPVGADGIRPRRVHGPRTLASTQLRQACSADYEQAMKARINDNPFIGHYWAATP